MVGTFGPTGHLVISEDVRLIAGLNRLTLDRLLDSCESVLGRRPEERTITAAYHRAKEFFEAVAVDMERYECGHCQAPTSVDLIRCWACGRSLEFPTQLTFEQLKSRAKEIGVPDWDLMTEDRLRKSVSAVESRKRDQLDEDLICLDFKFLIYALESMLPDGWSKKQSKTGVSYYDRNRRRRLFVPVKGVAVQFSVTDGELDGVDGLEFHDKDERRGKHLGRSNYTYVGDIVSQVIDICRDVFERYR